MSNTSEIFAINATYGIYVAIVNVVLITWLCFVILREKGGGLFPWANLGMNLLWSAPNVEPSVCQKRLSEREIPFGTLTGSRPRADSRALGRFRAIPVHAFDGGRMPLSTPRTRILERTFENNEDLRTAVSLRCRNAVLGMQNPSRLVLPFFHIVIRVVIVIVGIVLVVVVCSVETYDRNLVTSRMRTPWE